MNETPGYFASSGGVPLYAVHHAPCPEAPSPGLPVLLAPPLFEERKCAYRALVALARDLAARGHPVLRFDFRGSGESGGSGGARRWAGLAEDLAAAAACLKDRSGKENFALVGLRLGATLCLREAARVRPEKIIAIAPVCNGAAQVRRWKMRSKIRAEWNPAEAASSALAKRAEDGVLDLDGFEVAAAFLDEIGQLDLRHPPPASPALPCPVRLVQISFRETPTPETQQLQAALAESTPPHCLRMEPFWERLDGVNLQPLLDAVREALREP